MKPEDVFASYKLIKELGDVQKKSTALKNKLKKDGKLTPSLTKQIEQIDELDEMNETISIYKTKKSSDLDKATEMGAVDLVDQFRNSNKSLEQLLRGSKFKNKKEMIQNMAIIVANNLMPVFRTYPIRSSARMMVKAEQSKSKLATNKENYSNYFKFNRALADILPHQYMALLRGEREKALKISWDLTLKMERQMKNEVYREYGKNFIENSILLKEILNLLEIKLMTHFKRKLKSDKKKEAENSSQG